jgi:hypothetical protein
MSSAVVLFIFNRPRQTERVLEKLAAVRPRTLFVVADGPRPDHAADLVTCAATRALIDRLPWRCELVRIYAEQNLGCGIRIPDGLNRVFEYVPEAIILEDDCLAHPSFFPYCDVLLERYRDDTRIMHVSGTTYLEPAPQNRYGYYFTKYPMPGAWATWKRAWRHFDRTMASWPEVKQTGLLRSMCESDAEVESWRDWFDALHREPPIQIWDAMWTYSCWAQSGLAISPRINMISNIGFGPDATNTKWTTHWAAELPAHDIGDLRALPAPSYVLRDRAADVQLYDRLRSDPTT